MLTQQNLYLQIMSQLPLSSHLHPRRHELLSIFLLTSLSVPIKNVKQWQVDITRNMSFEAGGHAKEETKAML